jgi:methyl coenzyme M reductase subunit C
MCLQVSLEAGRGGGVRGRGAVARTERAAVLFTVHVQTRRCLHYPPHSVLFCIFPHDVTPLFYLYIYMYV